jgi:hypothetical protein
MLSFFFSEHARELCIIVLIEEEESNMDSHKHTGHTQTYTHPTKPLVHLKGEKTLKSKEGPGHLQDLGLAHTSHTLYSELREALSSCHTPQLGFVLRQAQSSSHIWRGPLKTSILLCYQSWIKFIQ